MRHNPAACKRALQPVANHPKPAGALRRDLTELLLRKTSSVVFQPKRGAAAINTSIHFEDEFSRRCSIMEISTQDGFGLLEAQRDAERRRGELGQVLPELGQLGRG